MTVASSEATALLTGQQQCGMQRPSFLLFNWWAFPEASNVFVSRCNPFGNNWKVAPAVRDQSTAAARTPDGQWRCTAKIQGIPNKLESPEL